MRISKSYRYWRESRVSYKALSYIIIIVVHFTTFVKFGFNFNYNTYTRACWFFPLLFFLPGIMYAGKNIQLLV